MTAVPPASPVTEGLRSLEVRWILRWPAAGCGGGGRFGRFPVATDGSLEDAYLLDPNLPGLSVKVRGGRALEVKMYRDSPGLLGSVRASPRPPPSPGRSGRSRMWPAQPRERWTRLAGGW